MSNPTTSLLKSCARDLIEIRAQLPNNLEPRIDVLFESVVGRLKQAKRLNDQAAVAALVDDGLALVGRVAQVVAVISGIFDRFHH